MLVSKLTEILLPQLGYKLSDLIEVLQTRNETRTKDQLIYSGSMQMLQISMIFHAIQKNMGSLGPTGAGRGGAYVVGSGPGRVAPSNCNSDDIMNEYI